MTPLTPGTALTPISDLSKKQRHNLREQRRILRISHQFSILRHKLELAGYSLQKTDKYSVLQATLEYITHLEKEKGSYTKMSKSSNAEPSPQSRAPTSTSDSQTFMTESMSSPAPTHSVPAMQQHYVMDLESSSYTGSISSQSGSFRTREILEDSSATYRDVFCNSSMPSLLCKLDGTIVDANTLFMELSCKNIDELRLHSLYTMCTQMDTPTMYKLVNRVLSCEMASAQSKMIWSFANSRDRKVFVSISMVHDNLHRPANLHCSLLPLT